MKVALMLSTRCFEVRLITQLASLLPVHTCDIPHSNVTYIHPLVCDAQSQKRRERAAAAAAVAGGDAAAGTGAVDGGGSGTAGGGFQRAGSRGPGSGDEGSARPAGKRDRKLYFEYAKASWEADKEFNLPTG